MSFNFAQISAACNRAAAAYAYTEAEATQQFQALGNTLLGFYTNDDHQAVISTDVKGAVYLSISGTRFTECKFDDLFDDFDLALFDLGDDDGSKVTQGAYNGLNQMWEWAKSFVPAGTVFNVEGHSLGAWRTLYTPLFLPSNEIGMIHAFEAPKGANELYWQKYATQLASSVNVVNQNDIFYGWPEFDSEVCHPEIPTLWLHPIGYDVILPSQWPEGWDFSDHSVDLVAQRLKVLV
jgi:hypothetical protein